MIRIDIQGAVQGVGFRPAVYRAAVLSGISGTVANATDGVHIWIDGSEDDALRLMDNVQTVLPQAARIDRIGIHSYVTIPEGYTPGRFKILPSLNASSEPTDLCPDIAVCRACLEDMRRDPRRIAYPLTNCTECGPRFSITEHLPYDRSSTSMRQFVMCTDCRSEYSDPLDRRFHAQPVSCLHCGPVYNHSGPADIAAELIERGNAVMIKGLGGYNIICDASDTLAVTGLRSLKHRPRKPFAVMMPSLQTAGSYVYLSDVETEALKSWRAPVVIAQCRKDSRSLPDVVAPGCDTLGVILPYMGLHHMIAERLPDMPLIFTSANRPGQPIITDDDEAIDYAHENGLEIISYNRSIVNRLDDSVVRFISGQRLLLRRSRGFVPDPIPLAVNATGVVGTGADITSQWAIGRGHSVIQSPYIGSLLGAEGERALRESIASMSRLYSVSPTLIVTDAHPAYASARIGRELASHHSAKVITMYHHHAHAVSVMADRSIEGTVLALVLDGTGAGPGADGKGTDTTVWGAELMQCSVTEWKSLCCGEAIAMPGGDRAAREPWRMGVSAVIAADGSPDRIPVHLTEFAGQDAVNAVIHMIARGINSPRSRGAGRIWDAVAALLGLAYTNSYEAEAPTMLEQLARRSCPQLPYQVSGNELLTVRSLIKPILDDLNNGISHETIAARFHATYAETWARIIIHYSGITGINRCVASGGVMQNSLLTEQLNRLLSEAGIELYLPYDTPVNDGCIAVGQVLYGATKLSASLPDGYNDR